jgi:ribosomal protein S18 acetylase RimI-like enzyme
MDLLQTGEDRSRLLSPYLPLAKITEEQGELTGYYLSGLKEGLIVAKNVTAGFALMAEKSKSSDTFVVPEQNTSAIKLLEDSGFRRWRHGVRMSKGDTLNWSPQNVYSRVSGGFG